MKPLVIVINAQLTPGGLVGGVEQFVMGLVHGLGTLDDGPEEYIIVGPREQPDWLKPYTGKNQRIISGPRSLSGLLERTGRLLGPFRHPASQLWTAAKRVVTRVPDSSQEVLQEFSRFYESLGANLVHFPSQSYTRCSLPTIYNPHDLQHLHYPQFFTQQHLASRETIYRAGCFHAEAVAVPSRWTKNDIIQQYGIDSRKIYAVHQGAPTELYGPITDADLNNVRTKSGLAEVFALYPAQTWEHKNHIKLLEAIKLLKDKYGLAVNLVCTGRRNDYWPKIERRIHELGLEKQVQFLGIVSAVELKALYRLAEFVVLPSLFEGGGFPILEAFREGTPVTCSSATSLPEYGGDAVLLFNPDSVEGIAEAIRRMKLDAGLRARLVQRGAERASLFTWERMARTYRALYRKLAARKLSDEENFLLENEPP